MPVSWEPHSLQIMNLALGPGIRVQDVLCGDAVRFIFLTVLSSLSATAIKQMNLLLPPM